MPYIFTVTCETDNNWESRYSWSGSLAEIARAIEQGKDRTDIAGVVDEILRYVRDRPECGGIMFVRGRNTYTVKLTNSKQ